MRVSNRRRFDEHIIPSVFIVQKFCSWDRNWAVGDEELERAVYSAVIRRREWVFRSFFSLVLIAIRDCVRERGLVRRDRPFLAMGAFERFASFRGYRRAEIFKPTFIRFGMLNGLSREGRDQRLLWVERLWRVELLYPFPQRRMQVVALKRVRIANEAKNHG